MTKPQAGCRRPKPRGIHLDIGPDRLAGRLPGEAAGQVAIVVDGTVQAVLGTTPDGGFGWALPHDLLGRLLDVIAVETGRSVLGGPVAFEAYRRLRWEGWALQGRTVAGSFALEGPAAPPAELAIPVAFLSQGVVYGQCFAFGVGQGADAGRYRFSAAIASAPRSTGCRQDGTAS